MVPAPAEILRKLNTIYSMLDELATDWDPADPPDPDHLAELQKRRDATREAIDQLIQLGVSVNTAALTAADNQMDLMIGKLCIVSGTAGKIQHGLDVASQVVSLVAELFAKVI